MKIWGKILLYILPGLLVVFAITFGFVNSRTKDAQLEDKCLLADSYASNTAQIIQSELNNYLGVTRGMAQSFPGLKRLPKRFALTIYQEMLKNIFIDNVDFKTVWGRVELSILIDDYYQNYGHAYFQILEENSKPTIKLDTLSLSGDDVSSDYYKQKISGEEMLTNPSYKSYTGIKEDRIYISSIASPIKKSGQFQGLVGVDIEVDKFSLIVNRIKPFKNSRALLIANNGRVIVDNIKGNQNQSLSDIFSELNNKYDLTGNIRKGKQLSFMAQGENNIDGYITLAPITIGNIRTSWSYMLIVPKEDLLTDVNANFKFSLLVAFLGILLITGIVLIISRKLSHPLMETTGVLKKLEKGNFEGIEKLHIDSKDEIGEMAGSVNKLIEGLSETADFANEIRKGNLDAHFKPLSQNDILGNALIEMRKSLQFAENEANERQKQDEIQKWTSNGIALFSDILHQNFDNLYELSYKIISELVKYVNVNQGGLFSINNLDKNDTHVELLAAYAYEKRKLHEKKLPLKSGLIGRCIQEQETIYMNEIPDDYIHIRSGLGGSNPHTLLLVPLIYNKVVFGVAELASFKEIASYKIDFIKKIGEIIASTLSNARVNTQTRQLLEISKQKSQELIDREKETNERITYIQEKLFEENEKRTELQSIIDTIKSNLLVIIYNSRGKIIDVGDAFADFYSVSKLQLIGKYHKELVKESIEHPQKYEEFWQEVMSGNSVREDFVMKIGGEERKVNETYIPIKVKSGQVKQVIAIRHH